MIPSIVSTQLQATIRDYLRTTFSLRDRVYERALLDVLGDRERGLFKGPYVDLRLPFRKGAIADAPLFIKPSFDPYAHQLRAWERLASATQRPRSTLVATGTGSGKTECFLYPLLDHCFRHRGQPGIKAIILYPMNALASDQAERIAREIYNWPDPAKPQLRGQIRAGLYVGGKGSQVVAEEHHLEDMRQHLRTNPPDILLTNYRMLDFLLLRPEDGVLWQRNGERTLQYLVLDELHTYDGAQGTDVAFLIRRLKRRLHVPAGHLCCVGTSATIGSDAEQGRDSLLRFAAEVFGEPFDSDAIVAEDRLNVREAFPDREKDEDHFGDAFAAPRAALEPGLFPGPCAYLEAQARRWLGAPPAGRDAWVAASPTDAEAADQGDVDGRVALGDALARHPFLRDLLAAQTSRGITGPREWQELLEALPEDTGLHDRPRDEAWLVLASFLALVAHARKREGGRVAPFLALQVQLWLRELRHLLRRIPRTADETPPVFEWSDTLSEQEHTRYATQVFCRECGDIGLGFVQVEGKRELIETPARVGEAYLRAQDTARYVRIGHDRLDPGGQGAMFGKYLCPASLHLDEKNEPHAFRSDDDGKMVPIARLPVDVYPRPGEQGRPPCPACGADDGLTMMGSRATSLSSVAISHLFLSPYNSDRKLLAFTDSVQDASHRAGFFSGRTFRFVLRTAIQAVLEAHEHDLPMDRVVDAMLEHWRGRLEDGGHPGRLAATLLPPDLRDDPDYRAYIEALADPARKPSPAKRKAIDQLLRLRLSWEVAREFGLGVVIGRSLDRTACATATPDPAALASAAAAMHAWLHETRPVMLSGAGPSLAEVTHYLGGLVERLRGRGGIHDRLLDAYVKTGSTFLLSRRKNPRISRFGPQTRYPLFAFHGASHKLFEPLFAPATRLTWYRDWTSRALRIEVRDGGIQTVLAQAMRRLASAGLVDTRTTQGPAKTEPQASGLAPARMWLTRKVELVGCPTCGNARTIAAAALARWEGARCPMYRCTGQLQRIAFEDEHGYYRRIFKRGRIHRVFAAEHTGLLAREDREALETSFKRGQEPDAPNLLTCTPTLEMGIDIGDLSAVMLCSVPPLPANYVQRVGRAGRSTGNALVLAIANARPHDRYFFEQPEQMMRGHIDPPSCFLDAPDMLARQLVAHAMDSWAAAAPGQKIPRRMGDLLGAANSEGFPHSFFKYYEAHRAKIAADFFAGFGRDPEQHPAWTDIAASLGQMIETDQIPRKIRAAFDGVELERVEIRRRRDALRKRKAELEADPGKAYPNSDEPEKSQEHELKDIADAERSYGAQLAALSEKYPLNVLTDAGVLPNYAFPEPGVTLRATLLGSTKADPDDPKTGDDGDDTKATKKPRPRERAEYLRPASAAIREFAPFNSFYAEGRRIEITQLDLGSRQAPTAEQWRLCASCHHSERQESGEPPAELCPRCKDPDWKDQERLRWLIEFRKAWSTSTISEASTADESDEREQESYRLLELIEVEEGAQTGEARLIESDDMVFGYELLPRATLREINFGRQRDLGTSTPIAGDHVEQRGFQVCTACGRVQDSPPPGVAAKSEHLPWCKVRTAGAPEDFVAVGLYRHNTSEAIRVLLPVADHEVGEVLNSVRAALELGFRRKFGGQPAHLRITTMSEPAGATRQRFLVIYDTVPGGTGYLAELWRQDELFNVIALALEAMKRCRCVGLDGLDGCYRCVYAHQHQRELASISRKRAVELFESILKQRNKLKTIPSLSQVNLDSLLESELERRFITALRKTAHDNKWRWTETAFGGRQGFRIVIADDLAWEVRPQVDLGPAEGVTRRCRPDFVLVPVGRATRRIAIFVDGLEFHAQPNEKRGRIEDDIAKRLAILNASESVAPTERHWVWSLTWTDVAAALGDGGVGVDALLGNVEPKTFGLLGGQMIAKVPGARPPARELGAAESFNLLIRWLADPDEHAMKRNVITLAGASLDLQRRLRSATAEAVRDALAAGVKRPTQASLVAEPTGTTYAALHERPAVSLFVHAPIREFGRNYATVRAQLRLYDLQDERRSEHFERSWRTFLQAWNLLQFHEVEVTSSERLLASGEDAAAPEPALAPRIPAPAPTSAEAPRMRADLAALLDDFSECAPLLRLLAARDLRAPIEPYEDFFLDGRALDVDLVWFTARIALCYGLNINDRRHFDKGGWLAFDPGADDPTAIADALAQRSTQG